jgi:Arc/MetJ family transcription regulator
MKIKTRVQLEELQEAFDVILEEALQAAQEFQKSAARLRDLRSTDPDYEGRYGELAAAAFLLKLKADAVHETLERLIEAEPDEEA